MFSSLKDVFESVGVCLKNSKDVFWFEIEQATKNNPPTQKSMFFSSSFRCFYLTIDLVRGLIIGCEGTGVRHRIVMTAMLSDILAFLLRD